MKKFEYVWRLEGHSLNGTKNAESEEALRDHIRRLGGELVTVTSVKEIELAPKMTEIQAAPPVFAGPVQDTEEDIRRELKKWNWGAFFLTWIWGLKHGVWISLLSWFPPLQVPVMILLGFKGNAWAWKKNEGQTLAEFRASQRRWAFWGTVMAVLTVLFIFVIFVFFSITIKKTEPYQVSLALAKNDPEVRKTLGVPIKEGFFVWGKSSYTKGVKKAALAYSLEGPKDRATVYVSGTKKKEWEYDWIHVDLGKERRRINKTPGSLVQDHGAKELFEFSGVTKAEALKIAARVCAEKGWMAGFDDLEMTEDTVQGVWRVRTNAGKYDNNATIEIDQKNGEVVKAEMGIA